MSTPQVSSKQVSPKKDGEISRMIGELGDELDRLRIDIIDLRNEPEVPPKTEIGNNLKNLMDIVKDCKSLVRMATSNLEI